MTGRKAASVRGTRSIAAAAGGGFAAFYTFYTAAPLVFDATGSFAGMRVAIVMMIVVAVQPLLLLSGKWTRDRRRVVLAALTSMSLGIATLHLGDHWPGSVLLGIGFGVFVVMSTAWVKEQAPPGQVGRALGIYGLGSAVGGALGAPAGLFLAHQTGLLGVVLIGSAFAAFALIPAWRTRKKQAPVPTGNLPVPPTDLEDSSDETRLRPGGMSVMLVSITGHVLAVTLYAAVLSSSGNMALGSASWLTALLAFLIQAALALGRLVGGVISDRRPVVAGTAALVLLVAAAVGSILSSTVLAVILASVLVGFGSGIGQTAALTAMMRSAQGSVGTERVSAAWNIGFDVGLGAGALAAVSILDA